jgi:OmcA/MtrC family decaheme c-type cytochrome
VKHVELARKSKSSSHWTRLAAVSLLAVAALAGCGGGSDGAPGATGDKGDTGLTGPAGVDATTTVNMASISADAWANLNLSKTDTKVTSVAINSPPVVSFQVKDAYGNPVIGLTTANVSFAIAKLLPTSNTSPSKWVNYIVGNRSTGVPSRPSTDSGGTLVPGATAGTYVYTFGSDITGPLQAKIKAWFVDGTGNPVTSKAYTDTSRTPATTYTYTTADVFGTDGKLLDYDANLPHRVVVQLSGTAAGATLKNPVNMVYNFVPATGAIADANLTREVVAIDTCNSCHEKLAFHGGGGRVDTRYCVVCHTDQRKNGYANVASTANAFPALTETATVNATTGITSYSYSPSTNVADGEVSGNFTTLVHKIHQGKDLVKQNYHYAGVAFNNKGFSMLDGGQKMCSACHDNTKAVNADNATTKPSRVACGSCHDGINWATGEGATLADVAFDIANKKPFGTTKSGHIGRAQADDANCVLCHSSAATKVDHQTENITKHNPAIAAGLVTFTYEIKSANVNATTNDVTIEFGIKKDGALVTFAAPASGMANPLVGFKGAPSFLLAYGTPVNGIAPVDYDNSGIKQAQSISVSIASLLDTSTTATKANTTTVGSLAASTNVGYYIATLKGNGSAVCGGTTTPVKCVFPVNSKLRTVALQGYFTQLAGTNSITVETPRHAISVVKAVTGDTVRRTVVDPDKCSNCHEWFEGHGGNRVYQTQVCVMCHTPGLATSGRGISDAAILAYPFTAADNKMLTEWGFNKSATNAALQFPVTTNNFKDMIHGIHAGRDRVTPFMDARDRTSSIVDGVTGGVIQLLDFRRMDFPGKINNCETCHKAGTYSSVPSAALFSTYESIDSAYATAITNGTATPAMAKTALNSSSTTDTVTTPYAAACVSCHDNTATNAHITKEGGQIKVARSVANAAGEACATCHGPGKEFDAVAKHK